MGDYNSAKCLGHTISWKPVTSERFDSKALKTAEPELYTKFCLCIIFLCGCLNITVNVLNRFFWQYDFFLSAVEGAEMSIPKNLMFDAESTEFKPETKPVTASGARGLTVEEAKTFLALQKCFQINLLIHPYNPPVILM